MRKQKAPSLIAQVEPEPGICNWQLDEEYGEEWLSDCGFGFYINDSMTPEEVGFKFCPACGKRIG